MEGPRLPLLLRGRLRGFVGRVWYFNHLGERSRSRKRLPLPLSARASRCCPSGGGGGGLGGWSRAGGGLTKSGCGRCILEVVGVPEFDDEVAVVDEKSGLEGGLLARRAGGGAASA